MKSISKIFAALLLAIALGAGCTPKEVIIPTLRISTAQESFVNGTAYLSFSLSSASETDVVISLAASGNVESGRLSFQNPVTIPAGGLSSQALVTINDGGMSPGQYTVTISISGAAGAKVEGTSSVSLKHVVRKAIAEVSLSGPERFTDGKATLTLTPDVPPLVNLTVTLEVLKSGASSGKKIIPPGAISCPEQVVLPADQSTPTSFVVRVDMDQLSPVEAEAIIAIESVSAGGSIGLMDEVRVAAKGELRPRVRNDWSISYVEDRANPGNHNIVESVMDVQGFYGDDGGGYYIRYDEAGFVKSNYGTLTDFLAVTEERISKAIEDGSPYSFRTANGEIYYNRFPVGSYDFYVLGCDSQGHLTGEYAMKSVSRIATTEMREKYYSWLGEWEVNGAIWEISAQSPPSTYYVKGMAGLDCKFTANLGWDCELEIPGRQYVDISETNWYTLVGTYDYYYSNYTGAVAKAYLDPSGEFAFWKGCTSPSTGEPFEGVEVVEYLSNAWSRVMVLPDLMSMSHQGKLPETAPLDARYARYAAWLGDWEFDGMKFRVEDKKWGESFNLTMPEDEDALAVEMKYSPETGAASLSEQIIYVEDIYAMVLSGAWYDSEKMRMIPNFPYFTQTPGTVVANIYFMKNGDISLSGVDIGDRWIHTLGISFFQFADGDLSKIVGWGWAGDNFIEMAGSGYMHRPGTSSASQSSPSEVRRFVEERNQGYSRVGNSVIRKVVHP